MEAVGRTAYRRVTTTPGGRHGQPADRAPHHRFATWRGAFDRFAEQRRRAGVQRERIRQPVDDPHYVLVDLEFLTREAAQRFQAFLEAQVWNTEENSPALAGTPRARVADDAPLS
jgi:hypothetical protein